MSTTVIFETLKDGSLKINNLAFKQLFQLQERLQFQDGLNALSKLVLKNPFFFQKAQNFV